MNIEIWTFLISRNQYLDYRTIAAPDFICQDSSTNILSKSADAELARDENITYREIHNYRLGEVALIYRVLQATKKDICHDENEEVLRDCYGREISLIEGVIVRGFNTDIKLPADLFETVHQQVIGVYKNFWEWSTPKPASPTSVLVVQTHEPETALSLKTVDFYTATGSLSSVTTKKQTWQCQNIPTIDSINSVAFHPRDSSLLAVRCKSIQIVQVWNLSDLENIVSFGHEGPSLFLDSVSSSVAFSPDGSLLTTAMTEIGIPTGDYNVVKLWDWQKKDLLKNFTEHRRKGRIVEVAFSSDGYFLGSCGKDGSVKLWDIKSGGELDFHISNGFYLAIAFSPNGDFFATGDKNGEIKIWNPKSGKRIEEVGIKKCFGEIKSLKFSPSSELIASGDTTGRIRIWTMKDNSEMKEIPAHTLPIRSISFSPDGKTIASSSDDCNISLWDTESGNNIAQLSGHTSSINSLAFSHDGKVIASGGDSKKDGVMLWRMEEM